MTVSRDESIIQVVDASALEYVSIRIYYADDAADPPNHQRVIAEGAYEDGTAFRFDRAISELTTLTTVSDLQATVLEIFNNVLAVEGFS